MPPDCTHEMKFNIVAVYASHIGLSKSSKSSPSFHCMYRIIMTWRPYSYNKDEEFDSSCLTTIVHGNKPLQVYLTRRSKTRL